MIYLAKMENKESGQKATNSATNTEVLTDCDGSTSVPPLGECATPEIPWAEAKQLRPCSWAECGQGHQWRPTLALTECAGCGSPTLMAKQENCPFCNEPTLRISLRHDVIPRGGGVAKRCEMQKPQGESLDIILERILWKEVEGKVATRC